MDCWKTQFVTGYGTQASGSRVFISSGDKACSSGRLESASIDCNEEPDLANLDDEVVVSRSKVSTSY